MGDYLRKMIGAGSDCKKRAIGMGGVLGSIVGGGGHIKEDGGSGWVVSAPKKAIKYKRSFENTRGISSLVQTT